MKDQKPGQAAHVETRHERMPLLLVGPAQYQDWLANTKDTPHFRTTGHKDH